ncbi:hypothetical protein APHNP_0706 [Anaplasma phagocytophilum str. ApNP]|uniref:Uncharacterized protein n=1 Tax=Anaplasma phagocytophilum str. ApNP TaxID=1359153 RepID=A0A0F3NHF1_ANAPH|nr:hypothetical protein APHNP_0706 [Anaplasma phagocytophilum str. ApNP]
MKEDIQQVSGFVFFGSRHTLRHNAKKYLILYSLSHRMLTLL